MGWQDIYKKKMQAAGLENDIRSTDDVQVFYRKEPEQYGDWRDSFMKKMEDSGLSGDIRLGQTQTAARQTVTAPATTTTAAKKRERQVVSPYGTFLGGFSFARGRQKSEKELADEQAQQEAYIKEYRRLAGLDLDDYRAKVEQAGKKAQESKEPYNIHAFGAYNPQKTEAERDYAAKKADLNKAESIQYDIKGREALDNLTEDQTAALEVLTDTTGVPAAAAHVDAARKQAAREALLASGFSEDELSQLVNYYRNIPKREKNAERYAKVQEMARNEGEKSPIGGTLLSVPANLLSGVGAIDAALRKLADPNTPTDYNAPAMLPYAYASGVRGEVTKNLQYDHGDVAAFAYGVGTSMLDSAATVALAALGVPPAAASATLGGAAATDAMVAAKDRGLDDSHAIVTGVAAGVMESFFEKVSLESLIHMKLPTGTAKQKLAGMLKNAAIQGGIEGSEEMFTDLANLWWDKVINGDMADVEQRINAYMAGGMSHQEAQQKVVGETIKDIALDFGAGALAGGIMGGGNMAVQTAAQGRYQDAMQQAREKAGIKGEYQASRDGKTTYNGQEVSVEGVDKDGKLRLSTGESVAAQDVQFADRNTAEVYEGLANSDLPAAVQGSIARAYTQGDSYRYVLGAQEAYRAGQYGTGMRGDGFNADLTDAQRKLAYDLGVAMRRESSEKAAPVKSGKVVYEQGVDRKSFTDIQRTSVKLAEAITQAVNGEVHLYSTTQDAEGKRTIDQKDVAALLGSAENAPNGFYDHKTGNIYVDINAGNNGEGTILYTLGHEYTHLIHQNARESFDKLAEYLFSRYGEQGVDVDALVLAKREVLGVDYETAYEEVVADSMEAMLTDTNAAEKIAALKKTDKTLWEKLKDLVGKLLESVRGLYQNMTPNSEEGRKVQQMADALDKLSDLFVEGLGNVQTMAATDEGVSQQARDYSYAALTAKPDMQVTTVDDTANYAASSEARKNIIARAIAAAKTVGSTNENGNAVIHVDDTDTDVILSAKGLRHGLDRRFSTNAPVTLKAGEILKNAVRINELTPKKDTVDASYVLIGAAKNAKNEPYIVQFVVNRASNEVTSVDVLYSIGTKKEPAALLPEVTGVPATLTGSTISISSLLDYVNKYFPDILPESVLKHYGYTARPDGELGESALFQKRGTSDREILTTTAEDSVKNERERELLAEYKDKVGRLEGYEARLSANRAELTGLSLADGKKNAKRIAQLKDEIIKDTNRVEIVESQLKELEGRRGLQDLLGREKDAIRVQQETRMQELEEKLAEYREKYGVFPGGEKAARDIQLPKKSSEDEKISQTVRTILEAKATPEEMVPDIETLALEGKYSYEVYSDKAAIADASRTIKRVGWAQALTDWKSAMKAGNVSKKNTAMGWALYNNAANSGDTETALDVLSDMVQHQRSAAQALQATRILKQLSPETQLYQAQRSIANLQTQLNEEYGDDKAPKLKIDQTLAEQFMKAADQAERDAVLANIYRDIGKQMPSRFKDKWNAWRYLAMLGNVRTHVRNVVGNAGFVPVVAAKNVVATGIEKAVYRLSGGKMERSKEFVTGKGGKALLEAAAQDYAKVADVAMGGGKYSDFANANKYIEEGRVIFRTKPLEAARKANSRALDKEDAWFSKPHYAYAMAQYCKANGITAEMIAKGGDKVVKAREYAIREAQKATYRDTNAFSQAISELGRMGRNSKNGAKRTISTVMEGILPFRKTPANILARGVEYSPIGLLNGFKQAIFDVQKGTKTAAEAIDAISAGLTGTGLLALGLFLAAQGLVRGHGDDDDKKNDFMELAGHQAYALELPNGTSVTLDWLAPECLPFFVGVNLCELTGGNPELTTMADWLSALKMISEPMLTMSCLQSLNDVFDSVGYAKNNDVDPIVAAIATAATNYVTQGLPTILGQLERTGEGLRYTTFTSKNSKLTNDMQYALGRASAKIPIWDYSQIPYIDAWGRTESTGEVGTRAFNNFLNPAYTSTVDMSEMEQELLRLYEVTGEDVFPSRADKSFKANKQEINLTGEQYVTYAQKKGGEAYKWLTKLTQSSAYRSMTDEQKKHCVLDIYNYANQTAKTTVSDFEPDTWVSEAKQGGTVLDKVVERALYEGYSAPSIAKYKEYGSGIDKDTFFTAWSVIWNTSGEDYDGDGKSDAYSKIDKQLAYIDGLNLTAAQKRAMAIACNIKEKTIDTRAPW